MPIEVASHKEKVPVIRQQGSLQEGVVKSVLMFMRIFSKYVIDSQERYFYAVLKLRDSLGYFYSTFLLSIWFGFLLKFNGGTLLGGYLCGGDFPQAFGAPILEALIVISL
ncbi:Hypothetical predicted protein [Octopus vulgaris]|uniref:Uncharacterized protein n=1 Tax=Octopus vulgaris TaxID=6645 RepID=A0AA36F570_OCTVU|nr:Hypothetical predicted protein [Octopus vulgaris]